MARRTPPPPRSPLLPRFANNDGSRSEAIRQYKKDHPNAKPGEILTALKAKGMDVSSSLVSSVLRRGGDKIDVASINQAAEFIKTFKGGIAEAKKAIELVGTFVETTGCRDSAIASLDAYEAFSAVVGK